MLDKRHSLQSSMLIFYAVNYSILATPSITTSVVAESSSTMELTASEKCSGIAGNGNSPKYKPELYDDPEYVEITIATRMHFWIESEIDNLNHRQGTNPT